MVRRYYRRHRSGNRDKYSIENTCITASEFAQWTTIAADPEINTQTSFQFVSQVVPSSDVEGMRKVKHLTLSFSCPSEIKLLYALVYVPQGYEPNTIRFPALGKGVSLYEPNQYVMSSGVLDFSGGPLRVKTPLSRNLNSGDSIALVLAASGLTALPTAGYAPIVNVQYAITLQ